MSIFSLYENTSKTYRICINIHSSHWSVLNYLSRSVHGQNSVGIDIFNVWLTDEMMTGIARYFLLEKQKNWEWPSPFTREAPIAEQPRKEKKVFTTTHYTLIASIFAGPEFILTHLPTVKMYQNKRTCSGMVANQIFRRGFRTFFCFFFTLRHSRHQLKFLGSILMVS